MCGNGTVGRAALTGRSNSGWRAGNEEVKRLRRARDSRFSGAIVEYRPREWGRTALQKRIRADITCFRISSVLCFSGRGFALRSGECLAGRGLQAKLLYYQQLTFQSCCQGDPTRNTFAEF